MRTLLAVFAVIVCLSGCKTTTYSSESDVQSSGRSRKKVAKVQTAELKDKIDKCFNLAIEFKRKPDLDSALFKCVRDFEEYLSQSQCQKFASYANYKSNARSILFKCITLPHNSISECYNTARSMPYKNDSDDGLFKCYNRFKNELDTNICKKLASGMHYTDNHDTMLRRCADILD